MSVRLGDFKLKRNFCAGQKSGLSSDVLNNISRLNKESDAVSERRSEALEKRN